MPKKDSKSLAETIKEELKKINQASGQALSEEESRELARDLLEALQLLAVKRELLAAPDQSSVFAGVMRALVAFQEEYEKIVTAKEELDRMDFNAAKLASIGELAAGVSHEINNPLAIIQTSYEMLHSLNNKGKLTTEKINRCVARQMNAADRIGSVVKALRVFDPVNQQESAGIRVPEVVEHTLSFIGFALEEQCIEVVSEFASKDIRIFGSFGKLHEVFMNLLSNARDAIKESSESGEIKVKVEQIEDRVFIRITDDGIGMSDEEMKKVFDIFYSTKPAGQSFGLGLFVVQAFVMEMNGILSIHSESDKGTTVTIEFPVYEAVEKAA
jgi:two-component system NtrC family sensor kinase